MRNRLKGKVVSDKMEKTIVVEVEKEKTHPRYKKRYKVHRKYKAHDEREEYKKGEDVVIEESRPLSKEKRWRVISKTDARNNAESSAGERKKEKAETQSIEKNLRNST